jgi:hypothetical protein
MRIEVIGQRLLTGRMAIAQAALCTAHVLHTKTERYAAAKVSQRAEHPLNRQAAWSRAWVR